jgi:hypothetical protein
MEQSSRGRPLRSFALGTCIALSAAWAGAAHAQASDKEKYAQLTEPPAAQMQLRLGSAVAAGDGQVLAVGGTSVYAFRQNAEGQWIQTAKIPAPDSGILTGPMAFDGTNLLVRGYTPAQVSVVYGYSYDGSRWRATAILKGAAQFGAAIALDGCTALISSTREDRSYFDPASPSAFVHHFDRCRTGQWTFVTSLSSPDSPSTSAGSRFGASISVSGNTALVGAPDYLTYGRAYVYTRSGDTWTFKQRIDESGAPEERHRGFGGAVAITNDLALISARARDEVRETDGTVLVFGTDGTTWTQVGPLTPYKPFDFPPFAGYGKKIVITPTKVFVSAPDDWTVGNNGQGVVLWFTRTGGTTFGPGTGWLQPWMPLPPNVPPEAQGRYCCGHYGADIAVSGSTVVVGSPTRFIENKPLLEKGNVSVYEIQ